MWILMTLPVSVVQPPINADQILANIRLNLYVNNL